MKAFFGDQLLLSTQEAEVLYQSVRDLPIVDYHCLMVKKEKASILIKLRLQQL